MRFFHPILHLLSLGNRRDAGAPWAVAQASGLLAPPKKRKQGEQAKVAWPVARDLVPQPVPSSAIHLAADRKSPLRALSFAKGYAVGLTKFRENW